jgi:hypothetical protein
MVSPYCVRTVVYSPVCSVCAPRPVHTIDHVYLPASVRLVVLNQLDAAEKSPTPFLLLKREPVDV